MSFVVRPAERTLFGHPECPINPRQIRFDVATQGGGWLTDGIMLAKRSGKIRRCRGARSAVADYEHALSYVPVLLFTGADM